MKRLFTGALMFALTISVAQAQKPDGNKKGQKNEYRKGGYEQLNLTDAQKTQLKALREDYQKKAGELKQQNLSDEAAKQRRQELHEDFRTRSQNILTSEQKSQLEKMKSERKASAKNGKFRKGDSSHKKDSTVRAKGGHKKGMERSDKAQQELGLSKEQQDKVKAIRDSYKPKFESLRSDNALSQEQKKSKMQELKKAQQEEMKAVLTSEQIEKMKSLRKQHTSRNTR
jgi:Spy/CpxP family protein refolding chaperone